MAKKGDTYEMVDTSSGPGGKKKGPLGYVILAVAVICGVGGYLLFGQGEKKEGGGQGTSASAPGVPVAQEKGMQGKENPPAMPADAKGIATSKEGSSSQPPITTAGSVTPPGSPGPAKVTVHFAFNRADISASDAKLLGEFWEKISKGKGKISIVGHADSTGSDDYNMKLSLRRAESVAKVMKGFAVGSGFKVDTKGEGEKSPIADNSTEEGKSSNRRAEIVFTSES